MTNVVNEHYFSYLFDKKGNKIKYSAKPKNYGMKSNGAEVMYFFDFMLSKPKNLINDTFQLMTYDPTYFVSMYYEKPTKSAVDFSLLPKNCRGKVIEPNVSDKIRKYASSLDINQKDEDYSLGQVFAQKVEITCN